MKKKVKILLCIALSILFIFAFACSKDGGEKGNETPDAPGPVTPGLPDAPDNPGNLVTPEIPLNPSSAESAPLSDTNGNGALDIYIFGGTMMGSANLHRTIADFVEMGTGTRVNLTSTVLPHNTEYSTYNTYELFASSARASESDYTFSSGAGETLENGLWSGFYDCLILQTGRDATLNDSAKQRQAVLSAVKIARIAYQNNPKVKILLLAPYGHQADFSDFTTVDIKDHKTHVEYINREAALIQAEIMSAVPGINIETLQAGSLLEAYSDDAQKIKTDLFRFEDGRAKRENTGNRANSKGSYLVACAVYTALLDKSPVGVRAFGIIKDGGDGLVADTTAVNMQKLCASLMLNEKSDATEDIFYTAEEYTDGAKALIAVAQSYVRRGYFMQYDDTRLMKRNNSLIAVYRARRGVQAPELATEQNLVYSNCAAFMNTLVWEAFNYDIVSWATSQFIERNDMIVYFGRSTGRETDEEKAQIVQNFKDALQPGDMIVYRYPEEDNGHIMLYIGNGKYIHSTGGNYNYTKAQEKFESYGTIQLDSLEHTFFDPENSRYVAQMSRYAVLRPLKIINKEITSNTYNRMNGMWGITASMLSSHPLGHSVNVGDSITYTIKLTNNGSEEATLRAISNIPKNAEYVSSDGGSFAGGTVEWNVTLREGETKELQYTVKVLGGESVAIGNTEVNGVKLYCNTVPVKNTLSASLQAEIDRLARADKEADSILDLINSVYLQATGKTLALTSAQELYQSVFKVSSKSSSYLEYTGEQKMLVDYVCGGWYVVEDMLKRTQVMSIDMMMPGDLFIEAKTTTGKDAKVYLVLQNGELLCQSTNGVKILTQKERDTLLEGILTHHGFAILRPSYSFN